MTAIFLRRSRIGSSPLPPNPASRAFSLRSLFSLAAPSESRVEAPKPSRFRGSVAGSGAPVGASWVRRLEEALGRSGCPARFGGLRSFAARAAAVEPATSDGLTVEGILSSQWTILDESEGDWKSHAAAIAQSISLIKRRLQWKSLLVRLELLSTQLNKPDLWDDPQHAGKISREHGRLMAKMREVMGFEQELLEHIDMIKLAREESDADLELVGPWFSSLGIIASFAKDEKIFKRERA